MPHNLPATWPVAAAPQGARPHAAATRSRVRWGRLALAVAGAVTVGVATWSIATSSTAQPQSDRTVDAGVLSPMGADAKVPSGRTVHGEGDAAPTVPGAPTVTVPAATNATAGGPPMKGGGSTSPSVAAPVPSTAPPMKGGGSVDPVSAPPMKGGGAPSEPTTAGGPPTKGGGAPEIANEEPSVGGGGPVEDATIAPATDAPAATGAGRPAAVGSGELPYTGAETWIALVLGLLLLGIGVCVHVNAVRIGMTAMLYRRGILLRPVECARLANQHGFGRLRVGISNWLHRVLEENERSDFVTAR